MATGDTVLKISGTQLMFRDVTDFPSSGAGPPTTGANDIRIGTPTQIQIDLTSLGASGGARQSTKSADLGAERAAYYRVDACLEHAATPTDNDIVDFFWGGSPNSTAATGNPAGLTGADAAFTETAGNLAQLQYIGALKLKANIINIGLVGFIKPEHRYGMLILVNDSGAAMHTVMDETHITFTPLAYAPAA